VDSLNNPQTHEVNNYAYQLSKLGQPKQTAIAQLRIIRNGGKVKSKMKKVLINEQGMTTAEYAVGTIAAAGLGGVLLKLLTSPEVQDLIWKIVQRAFSFLFFS
jgi:hypothetical protein